MSDYILEKATDTAKKIRARLQREFPEYPKKHFSVKTSTYTGGSSLTVSWVDGPSEEEVKKIVDQYQSYSFDGQTDSGEYYSYLDEDGKYYSGAKFLFTRRELSDERIEAVDEYIRSNYSKESADELIQNKHRTYLRYVDYFDNNNVLKKEHTEKTTIDLEEYRKNLIDDFMNYVPLLDYIPKAGVFLIGKPNKNPNDGKTCIKVTNKKIETRLRTYFDEKAPIETFKDIYTHSRNDFYFKNSADLEIASAFRGEMLGKLSKEINNTFNEHYFKALKKNADILSSVISESEAKEYLADNRYLDDNLYLTIDLDVDLESYANGFDIINAYVNTKFKEKYGDLKPKQKVEKTLSEDEMAYNLITKSLDEFSPANKERCLKIITKNSNEVAKFIESSPNKMKNTGKFKQILKYEFEPDKSDANANVKIAVYQTAFGLWLSMSKDNEKPNIRNIYKLGNQTIEQSVKAANIIARTYNLSPNIVTLAKKMYLKG